MKTKLRRVNDEPLDITTTVEWDDRGQVRVNRVVYRVVDQRTGDTVATVTTPWDGGETGHWVRAFDLMRRHRQALTRWVVTYGEPPVSRRFDNPTEAYAYVDRLDGWALGWTVAENFDGTPITVEEAR